METSVDDSHTQPALAASGAPGTAAGGSGLRRGVGRLQLAVSLVLLCALSFVAVSNYLGWTARVEVQSATKRCDEGVCRQRLRVQGSQRSFEVSNAPSLEPGDFVDIEATCTPGCKFAVVAVWLKARGERVSLMGRGTE